MSTRESIHAHEKVTKKSDFDIKTALLLLESTLYYGEST